MTTKSPNTAPPVPQEILDQTEALIGAPVKSAEGQRRLLTMLVGSTVIDSALDRTFRIDVFNKFIEFVISDTNFTLYLAILVEHYSSDSPDLPHLLSLLHKLSDAAKEYCKNDFNHVKNLLDQAPSFKLSQPQE